MKDRHNAMKDRYNAMKDRYAIIAQGGVAVADLTSRVAATYAKADPADPGGAHRRIRETIIWARELVIRLELAELELAQHAIEAAKDRKAG